MLKAEKKLKSEKIQPFLIPGVIVFFVVVSGLLLIRPRINEILSIRKNLKREEKRLAQLTAKSAALEGLDQAELSSRADLTAKVLPTEKNLPLLLSVIKTVGEDNNIEVLDLQVSPGELATASAREKKEKLPFLSFEISVGGNLSDFKEFLAKVAKIAPLVRIDGVIIETEEGGGDFQTNFDLDSPYLFPPTSLGPIENPLVQITSQEENAYKQLTVLNFILVEKEIPSVPSGKANPFVF